ncbi:arginase [Daejeonia sp. YH14]|uniref:arginase n=1 Tax=Daejeonia sp. YH14 TaxID=3439042 RepID=UPI003F491E62
MNFEDFIIPAQPVKTEKWQIGNVVSESLGEDGIALLFLSDLRGAGRGAEMQDFSQVRKNFYRLSRLDFEVPVYDLGNMISGKTPQDSHYVLQEVLAACHSKGTVPVIVGGSCDFAYSLFYSLNFQQENISYTQISSTVSLSGEGEEITEKNFLNRIFSTKNFNIRDFHLLGYQKHLNEPDSVRLIKEVDFDIIRLAEMMNSTDRVEPFFRRADMITINCDAVESFSDAFSVHPQVNGLNRREICSYMKEAGLSENLKSVGIFNFNFSSGNLLNHQLLAQMLWYLAEGINIRRSHPQNPDYDTFVVLVDDNEYTFHRDTFSNLWYFGSDENAALWKPCSREDYELAKRGSIHPRFLRE